MLPYPRTIPALLRALRELPDPHAGIATLAAGGPDERYLAVTAAAAFGARSVVVEALQDPDPSVRGEAARQALRLGWSTAEALLTDATPVLRHLVLRLLRRNPGSGDDVIDLVRERYGDHEAAVVLPACTAPVVARLLPELAHAIVSWKVLARRHAAVLLDYAGARLAAMGTPDWDALVTAVGTCTRTQPGLVLDLLERYAPGELPAIDLAPLAARFPRRVAALMISRGVSHRRWGRGVIRHFRELSVAELVALDALSGDLLPVLAPQRRGEVYDAAAQDLIPSAHRVDVLPAAWRHREARRVLALPHIVADEQLTIEWSQYLPAAEALPLLDRAARDPDPARRAAAYEKMIGVARREPAALPEVLQRLAGARNERDKVRRLALQQLHTLIPHLVPAVIPALTAFTDASLDARDFSARSQELMGELPYEVLARRDADDAVTRWALGMATRVEIPGRLEKPLLPGKEHLLAAALGKRIATDTTALVALARLLGPRARHVPEIQDLLRTAALPASASGSASSAPAPSSASSSFSDGVRFSDRVRISGDVREDAVELWLDDPRSRAERTAELLEADPAAARFDAVWREVTGYSTTLLDPVLGFFAASRSRPGPPLHVRRWLPRRQRAYAEVLAAIAADTEREDRARAAVLKDLARVPVAGRELLGAFLDAPGTVLAEAALGALPWTDRPGEALPVLLDQVGGGRAGVALDAAGRAARFVSGSELLALLRGVLLAPALRVSSFKALVRLLGRYGPPDSLGLLAEVWRTPGTHPDVRAAVVGSLRAYLPAETVWQIYTEALASADRSEVRAVLAVDPDDLAEPGRRRFAPLVVAACAGPDPEIAAAAYNSLVPWLPWAPDVTALVTGVLADPESGVHDLLAGSLAEAMVRGPGAGFLAEVFDRLVALDLADPEPGSAVRDRPARRRLNAIADRLTSWARDNVVRDAERVRVAARKLASHPAFLSDAAGLLTALADLRPAGVDALGDRLAEVADLVAGRPAVAVRLAADLDRHRRYSFTARPELGLPAARRLTGRGDLAGGLLALALLAPGGSQQWSPPWQEALQRLRDHPDPDVSAEAYAVKIKHHS
ncbi:hypothetical protein [Winogradskya consettensis]|uniref:hypothetical protein n=1 Tax=Winogradskya consettensis TaxID=113560 RepID=UPI001BB2FD95|nr:hypothetical protein [Actinoplanes consettensis]